MKKYFLVEIEDDRQKGMWSVPNATGVKNKLAGYGAKVVELEGVWFEAREGPEILGDAEMLDTTRHPWQTIGGTIQTKFKR